MTASKTSTPDGSPDAIVIGAGLNGLGVAAMLKRRGIRVVVLERAERPGASWSSRYQGLRLNTTARLSAQPGLRFPRRAGRWPSREEVVAYAARYARHHGLDVRHGVEVRRVDVATGGLVAHLADDRELLASAIVVATGHDRVARVPAWPGAEGFAGSLIHSSEFRSAEDYRGRRVLLVGSGMSGGDIARLLAGVTDRLWMSVRTPPHVYPQQLAGVPLQPVAYLTRNLPARVLDTVATCSSWLAFGDLSKLGLPRPAQGAETTWRLTGRTPLRDDGFVAAVRAGQIELVGTVDRFAGREIVLEGGRRVAPDAVIAATGYRPALEPLVGHLGVLGEDGKPTQRPGEEHPAAPGLHFAGMTTPNAGGLALSARVHGPRIARAIEGRVRSLPGGKRDSAPARPGVLTLRTEAGPGGPQARRRCR